MRLLLFAMACLSALPAYAGKSPQKIFLRIHIQTTATGLSADQEHTVMLPPNGEAIQVRTLPEVSEQNLVGIQAQQNGTMLFFDHSGQINLDAVTAQNQGRILVVILNGYVIYAPVIDEQISNGQLLLPHPLAPEVIKLLQEVAAENVRSHAKA